MLVMRSLAGLLAALAGVATVAGSSAAVERKVPRPRIVAAVMRDADRDARADAVRLTYSTRIRHAADRDGRYPFSVSGYRIRRVDAARGRSLVIRLAEKATPDARARPSIRYRPTRSKPVVGAAARRAAAQVFRKTRAHGHVLPSHVPPGQAQPPSTQPPSTPQPPAQTDSDGDGTPDATDCAARDASMHPGAKDVPDLKFVDSNCDGIDGTEDDAIFVSPTGSDTSPGTKEKPKRQIQAAVLAAVNAGKDVYAAGGTYDHVAAETGVAIYGGYGSTWSRRGTDQATIIGGSPEGVLLDADKNVLLQLLTVRGTVGPGRNAYGVRAIHGSGLTMQRVVASAGDAASGAQGAVGASGAAGGNGEDGARGKCDTSLPSDVAAGGLSPGGRPGGNGGRGGSTDLFTGKYDGRVGAPGAGGAPGGAGGKNGDPGKPGGNGVAGANGPAGSPGGGGLAAPTAAGPLWAGRDGLAGSAGAAGNGGGGGGGGGGQDGLFVENGAGNGGGGGGGGGGAGGGGRGGAWGGGSFGVYLFDSALVVSDASSITSGKGGAGGRGGAGGLGGLPGAGGLGGTVCTSEVGAGGNGGNGGLGGRGGGGGGGAGGPSVGIFQAGSSKATVTGSKVQPGAAGAGGLGGGTPPVKGADGQPGIAVAVYP